MTLRHSWAGVGLVFLLSCTDHTPLAPGTLARQHELSDGSSASGNKHFFFLPPMVPQRAFSGAFDGSLTPTVQICVVADNACAGTLTTLSASLSAQRDHYMVNWQTNQYTIDRSKTYRIVIRVVNTVLGHADVRLVDGGSAKNATTGDVITLVDGRTLPIKFRIELGAVYVLDHSGGSVVTPDGAVAIAVPDDALSEAVGITVTRAATSASDPVIPGTAYDFGPDGTQFNVPVTLSIKYDPAQLPPGVREGDLHMYRFDEASGSWQSIPGRVDAASNTAYGLTDHFSQYALVPEPPIERIFWEDPWSLAYLDPAQGIEGQLGQPGPSDPTFPSDPIRVWAFGASNLVSAYCHRIPVYGSTNPAIARIDSVTPISTRRSDSCNGADINYSAAWVTRNDNQLGTAYITADIDGVRDSIKVSVVPPKAANLNLTYRNHGDPPEHLRLTVGQQLINTGNVTTFWGLPLPDKVISWSSTNDVISVTPNGNQSAVMTANRVGCSSINASVADDGLREIIHVIAGPTPREIAFFRYDFYRNFSPAVLATTMSTGCDAQFVPPAELFISLFGPAPSTALRVKWSPDGSRLAVWTPHGIVVMKPDGTESRDLNPEVTNWSLGDVSNFAWSPDGSKIAVRSANATILIVDVATGVATNLASAIAAINPEVRLIFGISWSPSGDRLVFSGYNFAVASAHIFTMKTDGTELTRLTNDAPALYRSDRWPIWSPDGTRVAFLNTNSGAISVIRPDGTGETQIVPSADELFAWSPSGDRLAFRNGTRLSTVNPDGSGTTQVVQAPATIEAFSWSPDGTQIVYSAPSNRFTTRIWMMRAAADGADLSTGGVFIDQGKYPVWRPN